ncbi:MAG: MazG nucleotide pyrophosphohydrolase domain-containing protein [Collinsella sp.]
MRSIWRLRQPDGCPWDRKQTHASIAKNMIEEAYEAVDCIETGDDGAHLREELGDVLMQVVLHAQIAADAGAFTHGRRRARHQRKLIRRHPHVFGEQRRRRLRRRGAWRSGTA